jgi:hypothetical protein
MYRKIGLYHLWVLVAVVGLGRSPPTSAAPNPLVEYHMDHQQDRWRWSSAWTNQLNISQPISSTPALLPTTNFTILVVLHTDRPGIIWDWGSWGLATNQSQWSIVSSPWIESDEVATVVGTPPLLTLSWVAVDDTGRIGVNNQTIAPPPDGRFHHPSPPEPLRLTWGRTWQGVIVWWALFDGHLVDQLASGVDNLPPIAPRCQNWNHFVTQDQLHDQVFQLNWAAFVWDINVHPFQSSVSIGNLTHVQHPWNLTALTIQSLGVQLTYGAQPLQSQRSYRSIEADGATNLLAVQPLRFLETSATLTRIKYTAIDGDGLRCQSPGTLVITIEPPITRTSIAQLLQHGWMRATYGVGLVYLSVTGWFWVHDEPANRWTSTVYIHSSGVVVMVVYGVTDLLYFHGQLDLLQGQLAMTVFAVLFVFHSLASGLLVHVAPASRTATPLNTNPVNVASFLFKLGASVLFLVAYMGFELEAEEGRRLELAGVGLHWLRSVMLGIVFMGHHMDPHSWQHHPIELTGLLAYQGGAVIHVVAMWMRYDSLQDWNRGQTTSETDVRRLYSITIELLAASHVLYVVATLSFVVLAWHSRGIYYSKVPSAVNLDAIRA